jgi:uncharacterized protein (DUF2267 family)
MTLRVDDTQLEQRAAFYGAVPIAEARATLYATFGALGEHLDDADARALADVLPASLSGHVLARAHGQHLDADELYRRAGSYEGVGPGPAREHVQGVLRALGELADAAAVERVACALPEEMRELVRQRLSSSPPPHVAPSGGGHTLASGRPGSTHPISEARPESAHAHSVARNANPHEETKLSSSRGLTQERVDESLATAHPDGSRTLGGAKR